MIYLNSFFTNNEISLFFTFIPEVNRVPKKGTVYYETSLDDEPEFKVTEEKRPNAYSDFETGCRWKMNLSIGDIEFLIARLMSNKKVYEKVDKDISFPMRIRTFYPYYSVYGMNFTFTHGNTAIKGEYGYQAERRFTYLDIEDTDGLIKTSVNKMSLELSYRNRGVLPYTTSFRWVEEEVVNWNDKIVGANRTERKLGFSLSKSFFHETMRVSYKAKYEVYNSKDYSHEISAKYKMSSKLEIGLSGALLGSRSNEFETEEEKEERNEGWFSAKVQYSF